MNYPESETLRQAAALVRERAHAAQQEADWQRGIAKLGRRTPKGKHMASWPPSVALAVADSWDRMAATKDRCNPWQAWWINDFNATLAAARAYLGVPA